jgi:hypothetical protein
MIAPGVMGFVSIRKLRPPREKSLICALKKSPPRETVVSDFSLYLVNRLLSLSDSIE